MNRAFFYRKSVWTDCAVLFIIFFFSGICHSRLDFCPAAWGEDALPSSAPKTMDCSWCSITYPEKVIPGQKFTVSVTLKTIPAGLKLGGDIHHAKKNAYLGVASWGGNPQATQSGKTLTFKYKMPDYKSDDQGCQPIFFLTSKGWNEAVKKAPGPVILPLMTDAVKKTFRPESATLKKSWIACSEAQNAQGGKPEWKAGETIVVPFEYYLDPSDDWGKTEIVLWVVGPWVDCPDGKYTQKRAHKNYGNCSVPNVVCQTGKRIKSQWTITLPKPHAEAEKGKYGDSLLLIAQFKGNDGKFWSWQLRKGLPCFARSDGYFELDAPTPGNLFTVNQKVVMRVIPLKKSAGLNPTPLKWSVTDTQGQLAAQGSALFPPAKGKELELNINIKSRGTFLLHAELQGKETRETTFAIIPDLKVKIGTGATFLGGQKFSGNEEAAQAARLLGMSSCRVWLNWKNLEPARGVFYQPAWDALRNEINLLNRNHIKPWLLLDGVGAWAIDNPQCYAGQFTALPVKNADIERFVTHAAKEFRNDIIGFEWLNEIVPGTICSDPVAEYMNFCKTASAAAKRVNPNFRNQIAGGLWPQTYRQSLISSGIMDSADILSIHYGTGSAIRGARRDLNAVGEENRVEIWDNETAKGVSTWGTPLAEALRDTTQSDYYFTRFPDELLAGCKNIVVFGGEPSPAGDWSHFWGDMSPRPSAAALAVLVDALHDAAPTGEFSLGKSDSFKLFLRPDQSAVLVVSSSEKGGETVNLPVGKAKVIKTDQQGNSTELKTQNGLVSLKLTASPYIIRCSNADALKAQLIVSLPSETAQGAFTALAGQTLEIPLRLHNLLAAPVRCSIQPDKTSAPGTFKPIILPRALQPGETQRAILKFENLKPGITPTKFTVKFDDSSLPVITRKITVNAVNDSQIGNLIQNPGFEISGNDSTSAADWNASGKCGQRVEFNNPNEPGHGKYVYRFENTKGKYLSIYQNREKLPSVGGEYVYSFWAKTDNLTTGSNFGGKTNDGKSWNRHWLQVFQTPRTQDSWQLFQKRIELPGGTVSATAAPVCQGDGWALIDNVQLVPYEGTEFCAFAPGESSTKSAAKKRKIDGDLSDFDRSAPIPLLGKNQLKIVKQSYNWTPENCSGVAWFNYDKNYLYCGIEVIDNKHVAEKTEANCRLDDSIRIAIHPANRLEGESSRAFCFDVSSAAPGGSGKHTLFRPHEYSGGLKSGSLAKDSSVYDVAVKREGNRTTYEIALPWSDLGGLSGGVGTKLGLSVQLTDNDGSGPEAYLIWGGGLNPAWNPEAFGMLTLTP